MLRGLLKTPAIWAAGLGLLASGNDLVLPIMMARLIGLLAQAMIPIMLLSLGLQLLEQKQLRFSVDLLSASCFRLLIAPLIAAAIAVPFGLGAIDHASGILQFGMPTAVVATIIAKEHDIDPSFIISAVVFTVLASLLGACYPREDLARGWELILLNQFHDIIPGSSITEVYEDT